MYPGVCGPQAGTSTATSTFTFAPETRTEPDRLSGSASHSPQRAGPQCAGAPPGSVPAQGRPPGLLDKRQPSGRRLLGRGIRETEHKHRAWAAGGSAPSGPARDPARGGRGAIARRDVRPWPRAIGPQTCGALWRGRGRRRLGSRRRGPGPRGGARGGAAARGACTAGRRARRSGRPPTVGTSGSVRPRGEKRGSRGSEVGAGSLRAGDEGLPGIPRAEEGDWPRRERWGVHRGGRGTGPRGGKPRAGGSRGETLRAPGGPEGERRRSARGTRGAGPRESRGLGAALSEGPPSFSPRTKPAPRLVGPGSQERFVRVSSWRGGGCGCFAFVKMG